MLGVAKVEASPRKLGPAWRQSPQALVTRYRHTVDGTKRRVLAERRADRGGTMASQAIQRILDSSVGIGVPSGQASGGYFMHDRGHIKVSLYSCCE